MYESHIDNHVAQLSTSLSVKFPFLWSEMVRTSKLHILSLSFNLEVILFCCLLINVANSLGPDQDLQNVGPDLGPNSLAL